MVRSRLFRSKLQFKLIGGVLIAFFITLIVSTGALVRSIGQLGQMATADRAHEEQLIASQRFAEAEDNLRNAAAFVAGQMGIAGMLDQADTALTEQMAQRLASRFQHDLVIIANLQEAVLTNSPQADVLFQHPAYTQLKRQAENGAEAAGVITSEQAVILAVLAPISNMDGDRVGTATVAYTIDSALMGKLNFGRYNMALILFASPDLPGISADEADGTPHLDPAEVEKLRIDGLLLAQVERGETLTLENIDVPGTPHRVIYEPLRINGGCCRWE